jgi:hypothetical protein
MPTGIANRLQEPQTSSARSVRVDVAARVPVRCDEAVLPHSAVGVLALAAASTVGVGGRLLGRWRASTQALYEGAGWAAVLWMLAITAALRWRSHARRASRRGFPLDRNDHRR